MITPFTMGSVIYFNYLVIRMNRSHVKRERERERDSNPFPLPRCEPNPIFLGVFLIYMRWGLLTFLLSSDCLLAIITFLCDGCCPYHLTCCLISGASRLGSDTELICNDIPKVFFVDIKRVDAVTYSAPLMPMHDFELIWLISSPGEVAYYEQDRSRTIRLLLWSSFPQESRLLANFTLKYLKCGFTSSRWGCI